MKEAVPVGAAFRERYAFERLGDGGVLVDLATGTYSRLNPVAAEICAVLARTKGVTATVSEVAEILGSTQAAEVAVGGVVDGLRLLGPRREPTGAFRYRPGPEGGYVLLDGEVPSVAISGDGTSISLASSTTSLPATKIFEYARAIAPKLLFLQSTIVMHGAATCVRAGLRVISGESGAGKTTTARAFESTGAELFAEDMLVLASAVPLCVHVGGEEAINAWARGVSEILSRDPGRVVDGRELQKCRLGEPRPVSEVWLVDRARRFETDSAIVPRRLGETDAALAMMTSLFLGGASPQAWRSFLSVARQVAASTPIFDAPMPAGLERLAAAIRRYTENSAS
jgi:hypothetical protein